MKSKFFKGLRQTAHAGTRIFAREVKAVVNAGSRVIDMSSRMMDKALEGKPGEVLKIGAKEMTTAVKLGIKETKDNFVDGVDMVDGVLNTVTGARSDVNNVAIRGGEIVGGKTGGKIIKILLLARGEGSDDDDDDDDDADDHHKR